MHFVRMTLTREIPLSTKGYRMTMHMQKDPYFHGLDNNLVKWDQSGESQDFKFHLSSS